MEPLLTPCDHRWAAPDGCLCDLEGMRPRLCDVCGEPATELLPDGGSGLPVCDDHSKEES